MPINITQDEFSYSIGVEFEVSVGSENSVCGKLNTEKQSPCIQQKYPIKDQQCMLLKTDKPSESSDPGFNDMMKMHANGNNVVMGLIIDSLEATLSNLPIPSTHTSHPEDQKKTIRTQSTIAVPAYSGNYANLIDSLYTLDITLLVALFEDAFVCQHYTEARQPVQGYAQPYDDTARYFLQTLDAGNVPEGLQEMIHYYNYAGSIILEVWDYRLCAAFKCPSCSSDLPPVFLEVGAAAKMWRRFLRVEQDYDYKRWNLVSSPEVIAKSKQGIDFELIDHSQFRGNMLSMNGISIVRSNSMMENATATTGTSGKDIRATVLDVRDSEYLRRSIYVTPSEKIIRNKNRSIPKGPKHRPEDLQIRRLPRREKINKTEKLAFSRNGGGRNRYEEVFPHKHLPASECFKMLDAIYNFECQHRTFLSETTRKLVSNMGTGDTDEYQTGGMQHLAKQLGPDNFGPADLIRAGQTRQYHIQTTDMSTDNGSNTAYTNKNG